MKLSEHEQMDRRYILLLTIPVVILSILSGVVTLITGAIVLGTGALIYGVLVIIFYLHWTRTRNSALWSRLFFSTWLFFSIVTIQKSGGLFSPIMYTFIPGPLLTSLFLRRREVLIWTGLFSILITSFFILQLYGYLPLIEVSSSTHQISILMYLLGSIVTVTIVSLIQQMKSTERAAVLERKIRENSVIEKELVEINRRLETSNKDLERFAVIAAHDLQEPLRMIGSYVQLLDRKYHSQLDEHAQVYIKYAVEGAKRMRDQMNALLEYSRISGGHPQKETTSSSQCLNTAIENLHLLSEEVGGKIQIEGSLPQIFADRHQIISIFQALIQNALKFNINSQPTVTISCIQADETFIFSIADNGIGIREQHYSNIFDLFQRLQDRRNFDGLGVGLAIAKRLVENHGGHIWVDSKEGKGSTFYFSIPNRKQSEEEELKEVS